jgi:hypothetical protein
MLLCHGTRQANAGVSPQTTVFNSKEIHAEFLVDKVAREQFYLLEFDFPMSLIITQNLNIYLSFEFGSKGPPEVAVSTQSV